MFPLQPKVCLFIQKIKRTSNKAFKSKENNIKSNNKKENSTKALKKNNIIYVQGKKKIKEDVDPPLKNLQPNELKG